MLQLVDLAGRSTLPDASMTVNRMGCGARQLAGREWQQVDLGPGAIDWRHRCQAGRFTAYSNRYRFESMFQQW